MVRMERICRLSVYTLPVWWHDWLKQGFKRSTSPHILARRTTHLTGKSALLPSCVCVCVTEALCLDRLMHWLSKVRAARR